MSGEEFFDEGLKEIMGDRYDDGETPTAMPVLEIKERPKVQKAPKAEPVMEEEDPFEFTPKERDAMARLASMAKWVMVCGGVSMLMWWFQTNGLMAMEAAYPCIVGCALLSGYGVGKNVVK